MLHHPILEQALTHHRAGRFHEAISLYRKILGDVPDFAEVHASLGDALKASGMLDAAITAYRKALWLQPGLIEVNINLGNTLVRLGQFADAVAVYQTALAARPNFAEAHYSLGNAMNALGRQDAAIQSYRRAVTLKPDFAAAHYKLGNALRARGASRDAAAAFRQAIAVRPDFAEAHNNLATLLFEQGQPEDAMASCRRALALRPGYAEAHNNLGFILKAGGAPGEAAASFRRALIANPDYFEAHNNLAMVLHELGQTAEALACYRQALAIKPDYAEAHNNLGTALVADGRLDEAIASYRRAIDVLPDFVDAHHHLGIALCKAHRIAEGFSSFTQGAKLASGQTPVGSEKIPPHKVKHDREQHLYMSGLGLGNAVLPGSFHIEGGGWRAGAAINLGNTANEIEHNWRQSRPQIVVVDDFLTADALEELRLFCLGSTIWRDVFDDGYVGAPLECGFACPLLAQIAEQLRGAYPGIFRDHPLLYAWAFKYDNQLSGTRIHADFAAVNVNFWITPDEANLDPGSGGLVVWDTAAPIDWDFAKFNTDETTIRNFLARENARPVRIPYRANRAVIFDSDLFHETDRMNFQEGYLNRRINITLLYGRRGD